MAGAQGGNPELERRATVRLVHYWHSICRNDALPAFVDFDPHRNPIEWDRCLLASCAGPTDVTLEHVGAALVALDSKAVPHALSESAPPGIVARILEPLPAVLDKPIPHHGEGAYDLPGRGRLLFRSVLLPFRSVAAERRYLLGAATFKIDPSPAEHRTAAEGGRGAVVEGSEAGGDAARDATASAGDGHGAP